MSAKINNLLIPNVSKIGTERSVETSNRLDKNSQSEFSNLLNDQIGRSTEAQDGLNLSVHAARRLKERGMEIDGDEFLKIKNAMNMLRSKGGQDSLIITGKGAYIVDVNSNKIVTAMDKGSMTQNVFTKIDSTMIVD